MAAKSITKFQEAECLSCSDTITTSSDEEPKRENWGKKQEFILAMIGYSVGLGNVWRFPYLCYKNGGGAFLIPYFTVAILAGIPLFFLEIAMGQFTQQSAVNIWRIVPSMKGIGYGCSVINFMCNIYYILVMAWSVLYLVHSCLPGPLPWTSCENWWNTNNCVSSFTKNMTESTIPLNLTSDLNSSINLYSTNATKIYQNVSSSAEEFWKYYVLRKTSGLENIGTITNWPIIGCFLVSWIVIYGCIFKGTKSSGKVRLVVDELHFGLKVVYVTATLPYVMLFILFVRGLTLEGALSGIKYFLEPDFSKLLQSTVWVQAGGQIFYSYGICFTVLIAFGSYNKFNNNCYKQSIILATTCSLTSIFASFVIFSILGHMSYVQAKDISEVATSGPGLAFLVYPVGLSLLPLPRLWSILFFITLFMVGVDTQFSGVEGTVTTIIDIFPQLVRGKYGREKLTAVLCVFFIICGLPLLTDGGIYVFELFNMYAASGISLLWMTFFQSLTIGWIYGVDKFYEDVKSMIGYYPHPYFKYCYKFFAPVVCLSIFIFYSATYTPLELVDYVYPKWANGIGWMMSLASMLCVPFFFGLEFFRTSGSPYKRLKSILTPRLMERNISGKENISDLPEKISMI